MSYPLEDILNILVDNIKKYSSPFRVDHKKVSRWAYDAGLRHGGETILYTGLLYQLVPYIKASSKYLERAGGGLGKIARLASRIIDLSKIMRVDDNDVEITNSILRRITYFIERSGIDIGYLYEDEPYSGVLLYDLGMIDVFKRHAEKVYNVFKMYGVRRIITVDPHTTYVMSRVYPEYIDGFDIDVINYLDLIDIGKLDAKEIGMGYVIHDPCIYARLLDIVDRPREILKGIGIEYIDISMSKKATYCCGGPIESIFPTLSSEISRERLTQLIKASKNIITLCPICLVNLMKVRDEDSLHDINIVDFSQAIG